MASSSVTVHALSNAIQVDCFPVLFACVLRAPVGVNDSSPQLWVVLCLYLILVFIRFISKTVYTMREILNWTRINLFSNEILDDYLVSKMTEPIVSPQLELF